MKVIVATEQVLNEHGDLVKIVYHYEDSTTKEKSVFVSASVLADRQKALKRSKSIK